jgi:hypothetical protein
MEVGSGYIFKVAMGFIRQYAPYRMLWMLCLTTFFLQTGLESDALLPRMAYPGFTNSCVFLAPKWLTGILQVA